MNRCVKFSKVSFEQFEKDMKDCFPHIYGEKELKKMYDKIQLPKRGSSGSAGYDFYSPITFSLQENKKSTIKFPTGIRAEIDEGWVMLIIPRSSVGFKYGVRFNNTVGVIDSDYYRSSNEGHIFAKLCGAINPLTIREGERFAQGILVPFGISYDDNETSERDGGIGSTGV